MADHRETSSRRRQPAPTKPRSNTTLSSSTLLAHPANDRSEPARSSTTPSRRPGTKHSASGPRAGSSRTTLRSTTNPTTMAAPLSTIHLTRTGRISKAKKGLKVHNCDCGRSYTRAEHLRRHQKNHAQDDALVCDFPDCDKVFYRIDLLHRHQERHNEPEKDLGQPSVFSPEGSPAIDPTPAPLLPSTIPTSAPSISAYYQPQPVSPLHETAVSSRYNPAIFRTPEIPRTPKLPSSVFHRIVQSSPHAKPRSNHLKQVNAYAGTQSLPMAVPVGAMTPTMPWAEPYSQSPGYSTPSGYASPVPGPDDFHAPFVPGTSRTRTPSNASFIEPWPFPSHSPASSTSTMPYTWPADDKTSFTYMNTSYPMTGVPMSCAADGMSGFEHFAPGMLPSDEEETIHLFPNHPYGMAHTYPSQQCLDNFWRFFHPAFPIVHRPTVESMSSPPLLHAAMMAVGGQYSNDQTVRKHSEELHDRLLKCLDARDHGSVVRPDRLCDFQAIFMVEFLSQYRARRASRSLSPRFCAIYLKTSINSRFMTPQAIDVAQASVQSGATVHAWAQWVNAAAWQRLLVSCYLLEAQQAILLGRERKPSLLTDASVDLPFPAPCTMWDAPSDTAWGLAAAAHSLIPSYVCGVPAGTSAGPFDFFQSSALLALHMSDLDVHASYKVPSSLQDIAYLLDPSLAFQQRLLITKLAHTTPLRALLAVSGESWILTEKVCNPSDFLAMRKELQAWVAPFSSTTVDLDEAPVKEAFHLAILILQHAIEAVSAGHTWEIGADLGVYFAALVVWAVTTHLTSTMEAQAAATTVFRFPTQPPSSSYQSPISNNKTTPSQPPTITALSFLQLALSNLTTPSPTPRTSTTTARYQQGCTAVLSWLKTQLDGSTTPPDPLCGSNSSSSTTTTTQVQVQGELSRSLLSSIEHLID